MKTRIIFIAALLLQGLAGSGSWDAANPASEQETIKVCVTPGMGSLAESWISGYKKINPDQIFELKQLNVADLKTEVIGDNALGFVMQRPDISMVAESMWYLTLGREVILVVMNASNPCLEILKNKGVSAKILTELIKTKNPVWDNVLSNGSNQPVQIVFENEPRLKLAVSRFLNVDPTIVNAVRSSDDFSGVIKSDVYSIGFCRLASITDAENHSFAANILPLPLDRNGNMHIDNNENIYETLDQFERSVWIGKYPRSLVYNIYAVAPNQPQNQAVNRFLSWIVTSGQSAITENGYTDLAYYEKQSDLEKLNPLNTFTSKETSQTFSGATIVLIVVLVLVIAVLLAWVWNSRRKTRRFLYDYAEAHKVLRPELIDIPNGLFYDKTHTWAFMEKDGTVKVGIDDFLQHVTGYYTGMIMKNPNEMVRRNDMIATLVHEGKKINIYAPVSGRIIQFNEDLVNFPSLANSSPYSWGWLYEIEATNWVREIRFLKMADQYREWIKKEFIRLKDFIIGVCQKTDYTAELVLQEGGELPDHVLHDFEPHIWEEFQIRFLDNSDLN